jgi:drug/metabolite transporter (DMT)-like permease
MSNQLHNDQHISPLSIATASTTQYVTTARERIAMVQLVMSSVLFGICFVAQKQAMGDGMTPITFTAARYVVSLTLLLILKPLLQLQNVHTGKDEVCRTIESQSYSAKRLLFETIKWGGMCGLGSVFGSNLQQIGLVTVTAGKAAFYTAMYVIVVPIVEYCLPGFGAKLNWRIWLSAIVSAFGAYLLSGCASEEAGCFDTWSSSRNRDGDLNTGLSHVGDLIVIASMFCWVFSIIACDVGTDRGVDGVSFTIVEFGVCTFFSVVLSLVFEPRAWDDIFTSVTKSGSMVLLVGITEAVSFLLATLGQIYVDASKSAVIFSFESVVGAVGGYFWLGEKLDTIEIVGCVLMLGAVLFSSYETSKDYDDNSTSSDDSDDANQSVEVGGIEMLQMLRGQVYTTTTSTPQHATAHGVGRAGTPNSKSPNEMTHLLR